LELERHRHDRSLRSAGGLGAFFVVASGASDLRVLEDRRIELHGLFSLAIEPQERRDFLRDLRHRCLPWTELTLALIIRSNGEGSNRHPNGVDSPSFSTPAVPRGFKMSVWPATEPICSSASAVPAIANVIDARTRDLGGVAVRRVLPA